MALRGSGIAVYAVELPGHDIVAGEREPFASITHVVEQVVAEIAGRGLDRILLWGHSSGTAFAVATARKLEERGVDVLRVFLGAQLLGKASDRRAALADLTERSDAEIATGLSADGRASLVGLDAERAEQVGAAYRHDCMSAHRYLADALDSLAPTKLSSAVTVVVAADDLSTAQFEQRFQDWQLLADKVELHALVDGGHYFLRTRPSEAARPVRRITQSLANSMTSN